MTVLNIYDFSILQYYNILEIIAGIFYRRAELGPLFFNY